jgi:hypothetical protein
VYVEPDTKSLVAVPVSTSPALRIGDPTVLFTQEHAGVWVYRPSTFDFAITPKGDRFVAVQDLSPEKGVRAVVVENWVETLARR